MKRLAIAAVVAAIPLMAAPAAETPISLRDSFRLGSGSGILCSAQVASADKALSDMFDQAYTITCRDAAVPVGQLYALKVRRQDPTARLATLRSEKAQCEAPQRQRVDGLGEAEVIACTAKELDVGYRVYTVRSGDTLYVAEGLAGYDSALRLGLRTIVADKPVDGEISIATTEAGNPASFARVQAGTLDPQRALAEAYRRNNSGNYAEAAEFFGSLLQGSGGGTGQAEALANEALQQSNLGNYADANNRFERAAAAVGEDPVLMRMLRNYRAMHLLNQQRSKQALAELDRVVPQSGASGSAAIRELVIDKATASQLSTDSSVSRQLSAAGGGLLPEDRAQILDAQAQYLRGTILRLEKRPAEATTALNDALVRLTAVRGGRVTSTIWMRGQLLGELASLAEERGDAAEARRQHEAAVALLTANYPNSSALLNSQARLAAFYTRTGQREPALALFRQIVDANVESGNSSPTLRRTLAPYFALLAEQGTQPAAAADMFKAGQILVRPGVAQTQAILARELSGGSGDASRLFRQSVTLTRDIERTRIEANRLAALPEPTASDVARLGALRTQLTAMEKDQVATQAKLADFPRYRVISSAALTLPELQQVLRPGEGYYKMIMAGDRGYAILVTDKTARAFPLGAAPAQLDKQVDALRDTITKVENGQVVTLPFDAELAHTLYRQLFEPVAGDMAQVKHLIFEPDGALLRLPPNLLITDRAGVDAYLAKSKRPGDEGFDFTGINWLGRDRDVSTAVSARAFRDIRQASRSQAAVDYIGFGQNAVPAGELQSAAAVRGFMDQADTCSWSIAEWTRPVSSDELYVASRSIGASGAEIVTGQEFTDTQIKQRKDLSKYRIMHFATHGLVTAPRPECPARPALLTSFGEGESDGLLTFAEVYDLQLDADLVILSACDTAGKASVAATREAGLTTGGDYALDGLVRAFVGAGGRSVVASHWPVPDDYDATKRLISGLFTAQAGTSTAAALRAAQHTLMDQADTSHPYYWSGFAIIGDGAVPVIAPSEKRVADAKPVKTIPERADAGL